VLRGPLDARRHPLRRPDPLRCTDLLDCLLARHNSPRIEPKYRTLLTVMQTWHTGPT
jgi:hypothetical protein